MTSLRALFVEDDEGDFLLMLEELRRFGFDVTAHWIDNETDMRHALASDVWDVVVCDFRLPHFSGVAALDILRESGFDTPLIVVSGTIGEELAVVPDTTMSGVSKPLSRRMSSAATPLKCGRRKS
ncbi:MAG TPA: response regulator, partial [Thermoanaerobaculia bacterium]|nr:response regulator [Thermoanaerobaculia bacterium]